MNKEFELLREKLDIQKLNAQMNFSILQQYYSFYILLIVGVSFTLYFTFGFETFLYSVLIFTTIFFLSIYRPKKRMKKSVLRAFTIGNLMHKKLSIDIKKLNKELDELERKIKEGKTFEV